MRLLKEGRSFWTFVVIGEKKKKKKGKISQLFISNGGIELLKKKK